MLSAFREHLNKELNNIKQAGLHKTESIITSPQNARIEVAGRKNILNMCANNYLGLANNPDIVKEAKKYLDSRGFGIASVRFICGTQDIHKKLEDKISQFYGTEDTILFPSCFDANGGLFETILSTEDAVISDELNHASIIDGIRLCKANRFRYKNNDMQDLETKLKEAKESRFRLIATDGVFSIDGIIADLKGICALAKEYEALVMIDECHAAGFLGKNGRGTSEYCGVEGRIDIITGTLGKTFGGASGGYTTGRREIIEMLRQRSRPYLFSNAVAPHIVGAGLKVFEMLSRSHDLRDKLMKNTEFYRKGLTKIDLNIIPGVHPIVPIMVGDAALSQQVATRMFEKGVYCVGFFYPVVPQGKARIRTQVSADHSIDDLQFAIDMFCEVKREIKL